MNYDVVKDTRIGTRRMNQDCIGSWSSSACLLMSVADGLGGHLHGEVAAQMAIGLLGASFEREARPRIADPGAFLARAIGAAHVAILREAEKRRLSDTPRTVFVACLVQDGHAYWMHVGDSRLYLIRQGRIVHRTRDHTVVQQLIDEGRIREEAVTSHPERNRLLQCLGGYSAPRPDPLSSERLEKNDILLLCSDGFWNPLTQRQMLHALVSRDLNVAIPELMTLAEHRAGHECDNLSVVATSWAEEAVAAAPAPAPQVERTEVRDFTATDLDYLRVSDEDIEKAIDELKEALRRGS
ncbi:MAG TPA: protein phosphatase 2C domain-containing protein [Burkholderiales bacterium]|nr:protein phosphatase 2C domain-containing protein [Burkholderiales bacterium]